MTTTITVNSAHSLHQAQKRIADEWEAHEVWKPVPGYEGKYDASSLGRVRSVARWVRTRGDGKVRWVKSNIVGKNIGTTGYHRVTVGRGKRQHETVHRMVAMAFIPNPNDLPCINHIDGDKTNNAPGNLEWCTQGDNVRHAYRIGLSKKAELGRGDESIASKLTSGDVVEIKGRIKAGERICDIARDYPVGKNAISEIKAGRSWGHIKCD